MSIVPQMLHKRFGKKRVFFHDVDRCVALGAAISASQVTPGFKGLDMQLFDITLVRIGIEVNDGRFEPVTPSGSIAPAKRTLRGLFVRENQTRISFNVYAGDHSAASSNSLLGLEVPTLPTDLSLKYFISFSLPQL